MHWTGYPLHRENGKNENILSVKTQGIGKFSQNTEKAHGIWFAQVVNSLILKVKDIAIFAVEIFPFFPQVCWIGLPSQFYVCYSHGENLQLDRENTGNLKIQFNLFEWVPW